MILLLHFSFNGLFAPYWRSDARGMMIGLTQFTSKNHICRAAIEAVAFQVETSFDVLVKSIKKKH